MKTLLIILAAGIGTYFNRAVFIVALANRRIPPTLTVAMDYVGPAVLASLVVTLLGTPEGEITLGAPEAAALGVAALLSWKTRNQLLTLLVAMTLYWGLRAMAAL